MRSIAGVLLVLSIGLLACGWLLPIYVRSSLFDRRPMYDRAATTSEEASWGDIRQGHIRAVERLRRVTLWVGSPLAILALALLFIG